MNKEIIPDCVEYLLNSILCMFLLTGFIVFIMLISIFTYGLDELNADMILFGGYSVVLGSAIMLILSSIYLIGKDVRDD